MRMLLKPRKKKYWKRKGVVNSSITLTGYIG